jgi:metallo-beta-lactamase family protein
VNRIRLTFLGAAQNVTGSRYLLEQNGSRILIDCGLYQERDLRIRNWDPFPVPPHSLNVVLLTHAHVDHCGYLPKLVKDGFRGPVYCTPATAEIAGIVLKDTGHLQEEDAAFKLQRHSKEGRKGSYPVVPLYTQADVEAVLPLFKTVEYENPVDLADGITVSFHDAGHILGSSNVHLKTGRNGDRRTILFSGDIGRWDRPILNDPTLFEDADYILMESTYGDRLHEDSADQAGRLADIVNATRKTGGNIVIPSFAVERAQEILYHLNNLLLADRIPHLLIFIDSPMAISVTKIFEKHAELFDLDMKRLIAADRSPFHLAGLKLTPTADESKMINHIKGTAIIIAGSGMCTGGRIKHHLVNNISRSQSSIVFVGYQAVGTLGRQIVDGAKKVRILGQQHSVKARIEQLYGFSAHADQSELLRWLSGLKSAPRRVFMTHGEPEAARHFADFVHEKKGWATHVPGYGETVELA